MGQYPDALDGSSDLIFEPGVMIPTTPWDSLVWNGIAQWCRVTSTSDLDEILPNRRSFSNLFTSSTVYKSGAPPTPTTPPPTPAPNLSGACVRSPLPMQHSDRAKQCNWVAKKNTTKRCVMNNVRDHCPDTCAGDCSTDSQKH